MISARWQQIKDVLEAVDALSATERPAALDRFCQGDAELRREVDSLLAQEDRIGILNEPADQPDCFASEPRQAGPYRIERLIGSGGMGAVYLGTRSDELFEKQVAIKIIQYVHGNQLARRFQTERRILAGLEHPTIARLFDAGALDDGRPYLVMEYVEGVRIDEYVDQQKIGVRDILQLFLKVCSAVQYAHQRLVVHRDLKAGNILVSANGEPRLLDFGIAKMLTGAAETNGEETRPFERLLTPSSASPEQIAGGAVTTASDVYSLGLLLYRLLTGTSAYAGARNFRTDPNTVIQHYDPPLAGKALGLTVQRAKELRGDLEMILAKTLEKQIARRYQTVEELTGDIQRYLEGRPIKARTNSHLYVARRFVRRNRFQVAAVALLLLAITGGVAGTLVYARRAERQRELAVQRLDTLRHISESLLFEFHDSIKDLPGSTQARALVVRRAIQYLDQLAAQDNSDPSVQRDLAAAYVRIGDILAGEREAHIGGPDAMSNAMKGYQRALDIRRRLFAAHPQDPALRSELLEILWAVSFGRREQGHLADAIQLQQERLQIIGASPQKDTPVLQYSMAATYNALSDMYRGSGDTSRALDYAQRSLAVRQALLDRSPGNARMQRAVGLSHDSVGFALADQDRYGEAAQSFEKSLSVFNSLSAASPTSTDLQRNVDIAEMNLCETMTRSHSASAAIPHCRRAVEIAQAMRRADPGNVQAREDLASASATIGFAMHQLGKREAARTWERQAAALFDSALAQDPDAVEAAAAQADTLAELAAIEHELHDPEACIHLGKARDILTRLATKMPLDATVQTRLAKARATGFCS